MQKRFFLFCILSQLISQLPAQLYPFTVFNTSNGLINNRCGNISQDSAGYIWIGTDHGICNYDGRKFNFFPGKSSTYYFGQSTPAMYKGKCLLGSSNEGLAVCAGNQLEFIVPPSKNQGTILCSMALNDSTYLLGRTSTANKLLLLKGKTEQEITIPEVISKKMKSFLGILQDAEKNIWVNTDAGVVVFIKGDFSNPFIVNLFLGRYCNYIKPDNEKNLFVAIEGKAYKVDKTQLQDLATLTPQLFFESNETFGAMGILNDGSILLSIENAVKIFDRNLRWIKDLRPSNGLPTIVWDIFQDRENNIWFATENGLLRLRSTDFTYYLSSGSPFPSIGAGAVFNDRFLFSNGYYIFSKQNEQITRIQHYRNVISYRQRRFMVTPGNELWITIQSDNKSLAGKFRTTEYAISGNIAIQGRDIQAVYNISSPVNMDQAVAISGNRLLFLTDSNKLYLYDNKKMLAIVKEATMPDANVVAKGNALNDVWLINDSSGLYHCELQYAKNTVYLKLLQHISFTNSKQRTNCRKLLYDKKDALWLATKNQGIIIFRKRNHEYYLAENITVPAISSHFVTDILKDNEDNIWIATNNGLDKVSFSADGHYTIANRLYDNMLTGRMIYFLESNKNILYIGTTGSLGVANIGIAETKISPLVQINHLYIANRNADSLLLKSNIFLAPDENNLSFEFVAPSFINEKQTVYQYKLEGADTAWSIISANYTVSYNQLKPGKYKFKVRAKNAENIWSDQDAIFSFNIQKPFYKHWAFYLLCIGICCGFVYWLYRQKIAGILAVEQTRQHISKDLHDDIGSTLSSITLMNAVLKNKIDKNPVEAAKLAEKIEDTSRQMIQNMSDIVWSINPGNDTIDKLQNRLQQFCADVFEDTNTHHKLSFSDNLLKKSLPMQLRRDVYLICKEITNNAAKYSHAKNYMLALGLDKHYITIEAFDDGIGFDDTVANSGNGLNNIRQRVVANSGTALLATQQGTKWSIKIPIE